MLFLAVAWGLLATTSLVTSRVSKPTSTLFHGFVACAGLLLLALHLIGYLLLDRSVGFHVLHPIVPYRSSFRPFASRSDRRDVRDGGRAGFLVGAEGDAAGGVAS